MACVNIEIKAVCRDHDAVRRYLKSHHAEFRGEDHQIDTYFRVPWGRLKLREGVIENALIHYARVDDAGPKRSDVTLHPVTEPATLKAALTAALGVDVVVDKRREIWFIDNVKFHLDRVEGLGSFLEIEAIDIDGGIGVAALQQQCRQHMAGLGICSGDLLERSYSDMVGK